jgi:hypothetical protein
MSISTPCTIPRAPRYVSSSAVSRDMVSGVDAVVRSSGTAALSAASAISDAGVKPPVIRTHGRSCPKTRASAWRRSSAASDST